MYTTQSAFLTQDTVLNNSVWLKVYMTRVYVNVIALWVAELF